MSIKGKSQELYIGKTEVNIKDYQWGYKLIKIQYSDISKIEYCFRTMTEGGYIDFHDTYGHFERFCFPRKSNPAIQRAIDYIEERYPDLVIEKHNTDDDPIYSKNVFIAVLSLFCCWPIGLILNWTTGKRTLQERIMFTVLILLIQVSLYFFWVWYTKMQINNAVDSVNEYFNQLYNFGI